MVETFAGDATGTGLNQTLIPQTAAPPDVGFFSNIPILSDIPIVSDILDIIGDTLDIGVDIAGDITGGIGNLIDVTGILGDTDLDLDFGDAIDLGSGESIVGQTVGSTYDKIFGGPDSTFSAIGDKIAKSFDVEDKDTLATKTDRNLKDLRSDDPETRRNVIKRIFGAGDDGSIIADLAMLTLLGLKYSNDMAFQERMLQLTISENAKDRQSREDINDANNRTRLQIANTPPPNQGGGEVIVPGAINNAFAV